MFHRIIVFTLLAALFSSCGLDKQAKALKAFEKCRYEFISADSVLLAGTDVTRMVADGRLDMGQLPGIAMGFLSRDIPLSGLLKLRITNPTNNLAGIQQFMYKIALEGNEIFEGTSDLPIEVPPGSTVVVPVKLRTNVYKFLSDRTTLNKLIAFVQSTQQGTTDEKIKLTFRIKPTIALGNKQVNYPGYITIDKQIDAAFLTKQGILR